MTVAELVSRLKEMPQDAEVMIDFGQNDEWTTADLDEVVLTEKVAEGPTVWMICNQ